MKKVYHNKLFRPKTEMRA